MRMASSTPMKLTLTILPLFFNLGFGYLVSHRRLTSLAPMVTSSNIELETLNLPAKLQRYVQLFRDVPDEKLRYQQLLFLAGKLDPMPQELKISENKVQGCLSTVHVHATTKEGKVYFQGDSDGQLTKGLVALLVNGLSECTADEIESVKPEFIKYAGIASSLTPGRNNGFLNMLALMKRKARELQNELQSSSISNNDNNNEVNRPIYNSITQKLSMLKPQTLEIIDESYKHAGHTAMQGLPASETHFRIKIVASCFDGLSLVQRHKMIYTLLSQEMNNGVHALSIDAKAPEEVR